ncbi:hypothetical protein [uncultured Sphingomonas sp.]|uniref:hypothetical protein n=1 Tax=uncultured Sphingomonas sp. TaxID=158754 RepID=UPI00258C6F4B|nr:hypothetical protein [uncultured Sphingomonas sp.]
MSGDPDRKWMDLKPLIGWPLLIGLGLAALLPPDSISAWSAGAVTVFVEAVWLVFLFRRWQAKAAIFRPASRFSDEPAGY